MENRALSCFQSRGPLFFFVATLSLSLYIKIDIIHTHIYIYTYLFFLFSFLFKFVFSSPLFVPLWSRLRVRKARGLFSGVRFVWFTELNRMYIDGDRYVELWLSLWYFFTVCVLSRLYSFAGWMYLFILGVSFVRFFLGTGLNVCALVLWKIMVVKWIIIIIEFVLILLSNNYVIYDIMD